MTARPDRARVSGGFYELDAAARRALANAAASQRRTLVERWLHIDKEGTDAWAVRARLAASMIADAASVADAGCGLMYLERYLRPGTRYIPIDVVARDERTIIVDLNAAPLPFLDAACVAALGLLEYLHDVPVLLRAMAAGYRRALVSYSPREKLPDIAVRESHAWVSHYSTAELEAAFTEAGLIVIERRDFPEIQTLWSLAAAPAA